MLELFKSVLKAVSPEDDWSHWVRKYLAYILIGSMTLIGFEYYKRWIFVQPPGEQLISVQWQDPDKRDPAIELIRIPMGMEKVKSVWLYAWDRLFFFGPLEHIGTGNNPLPLGTWRDKDEKMVGALVLGQCDCLDKDELSNYEKAYVCPVYGDEDVWGFIVITLEEGEELTPAEKESISAVAHQLSNLFFQNHVHHDRNSWSPNYNRSAGFYSSFRRV